MTNVTKPCILEIDDGLNLVVNTRSTPIRTLLVESRTLIRSGLCALLERYPQIQIVGLVSNLEEASQWICAERPSIVLYSSSPSNGLNIDAIPHLVDALSNGRLIILAESIDDELYQQAVVLGAMGVVDQTKTVEVLVKAIEKVHSGEVWLDRTMVASLIGKMTSRSQGKEIDLETEKIAQLGAREREIIALAGQGLRNKEIGERLSISEVTVRHYLTTIFSKLAVSDRLELIIFAYRHRLARPPQ